MNEEQAQAVVVSLARIEEQLKHMNERKDDHEKRIRTVEQRQWRFVGGLAVFSAAIGYFWKLFDKL